MMPRLTDLQTEFINQYFLCNMNGTEAALQAGYSCKDRKSAASIASENLKKPHIRVEIDTRLQENAMSADEVIYRLSEIARSSFASFIKFDEKTKSMSIDLKNAPLHLLKKISFKPTLLGPVVSGLEIYDAQSALVQLGRYYKLFTDRIEVTDWQTDAIREILSGQLSYEELAEEFDHDFATQLFKEAGIPIRLEDAG